MSNSNSNINSNKKKQSQLQSQTLLQYTVSLIAGCCCWVILLLTAFLCIKHQQTITIYDCIAATTTVTALPFTAGMMSTSAVDNFTQQPTGVPPDTAFLIITNQLGAILPFHRDD